LHGGASSRTTAAIVPHHGARGQNRDLVPAGLIPPLKPLNTGALLRVLIDEFASIDEEVQAIDHCEVNEEPGNCYGRDSGPPRRRSGDQSPAKKTLGACS
jgi:hypothetical protein